MSKITLEQVDHALVAAREQGLSNDDVALLWLTRAELLGQALQPEHLYTLMGVDEDEALDIFARLSERGLIEWSEGE